MKRCHVVIREQGDVSASGQAGRASVQPEGDHFIWEPRSQILTISPVRIESRARVTQPIRGVRSSLMIRLARECKRWHPWLQEEDMEKEEAPSLSICLSISLSLTLTTNCVPLSRIKWERERERDFYKEVSFISLIEVRLLSLIMFLVESIKDYTTIGKVNEIIRILVAI